MKRAFVIFLVVFFAGCGGGGGSDSGSRGGGAASANFECDGGCTGASLSSADVATVLRQAVSAAQGFGQSATFAVVDRVGNVLAVYQMAGANSGATIDGQIGAVGGLEGATVPAALAAISKAGTGAFLSSQGNGFTSRTASQIVQEHFNPGENGQPGGPLFGVQFSQLPCSDVTVESAGTQGPRPLPLGLSADPGGIPLYQRGEVVGGLGVEFDGRYTLDRNITDTDETLEEQVALVAARGFEAPSERTGDQVSVGGKSLRFADTGYEGLYDLPAELPELDPTRLVSLPPFTQGQILPGTVFGDISSGIVHTTRAGLPAATLVLGGGLRFPSRDGSSPGGGLQLRASEVEAILDSALTTAFRVRAAIRRPLDTAARVSIWVIDTAGTPLGFTRSQDAPVFGIDVSLQKARAAAFFSSTDAADTLSAAGLGGYVAASQGLLGAGSFRDGLAFSNRAVGNLSRPFFPDGIDGKSNGPFSHPFPGTGLGPTWSPFNTGIQLDLVAAGLLAPLQGVLPSSCTSGVFRNRLRNGIQIFPGSVPLYRGSSLIGAIGISGDGIDQDDLIAFYGASRAGLDYAGHTGVGDPVLGFNAPKELRSDKIDLSLQNTRLRYVNCPEGPFRGSNDQNVCEGL